MPAARAATPTASDFCATVGPAVTAGTITDPGLVEISGLAASRTVPGVLWADNDSGDGPRVYALSPAGELLGTYDLAGAEAIDWEDIAVGPGPDPSLHYVYVGDIGQNGGLRDQVEVYRVPEPAAIEPSGSLTAERIALTYPDGPEDAESMFVDPVTGGLVIVTKQASGVSHVLLAEASQMVDGATVAMQEIATITIPVNPSGALALPSTMATAADISPDGSTILVRTYQQVLAYPRPTGGSLADAFAAAPCNAPQVSEPQGEAIAFAADGSGYSTTSETQLAGLPGATLTFFPIAAPVTPSTTAPPAAPTTVAATEVPSAPTTAITEPSPTATEPIESAVAADDDDGSAGTAIALGVGAVVLVTALVGLAVVVRRRHAT